MKCRPTEQEIDKLVDLVRFAAELYKSGNPERFERLIRDVAKAYLNGLAR
jgi:hypothetical protein